MIGYVISNIFWENIILLARPQVNSSLDLQLSIAMIQKIENKFCYHSDGMPPGDPSVTYSDFTTVKSAAS